MLILSLRFIDLVWNNLLVIAQLDFNHTRLGVHKHLSQIMLSHFKFAWLYNNYLTIQLSLLKYYRVHELYLLDLQHTIENANMFRVPNFNELNLFKKAHP